MSDQLIFPEIVGVISGNSTVEATIKKRPSHTLIYKVNGESLYFLRGKQIKLTPGTVLFVPENESYSFKKTTEGESFYRLVNFHADIADPKPHLFTPSAPDVISALLKQMENLWRFDNTLAGRCEVMSLFYKLASLLLDSEKKEYQTSEQKMKIDPAMDFLEAHLFDSSLKTESLHKLCDMSAPTFRKIFTSRFGTSPRKYIIRQRLSQAKAIIESGEYKNISDVARSVGYDDPLYFSRHFKEFYGSPPSKF